MHLRPRSRALLLGVAVVLAELAPAPAALGGSGSADWRWPLAPPAVVVARFAAPAGPYAPGHRGVDLGSFAGSPVLAAGAGVVAFAGRVAGRGVLSVDHPGGLRTTYQPVAAVVRRGEHVGAGRQLGRLEAAGSHCPPASCLHWGLRRGAQYLDPLALLGPFRVRLLPVWGAGAAAGDAALWAGSPAASPGSRRDGDPSGAGLASGGALLLAAAGGSSGGALLLAAAGAAAGAAVAAAAAARRVPGARASPGQISEVRSPASRR